MRIDPETGVMTLGEITLAGGMTPADFAPLRNFRRNSSQGKRVWYYAPVLESYGWWPNFYSGRLGDVVLYDERLSDPLRKQASDALLREMLGEPHKVSRIGPRWGPFAPPVKREPWLAEAHRLKWCYPWGDVESYVEGRDWTSQIGVSWKLR